MRVPFVLFVIATLWSFCWAASQIYLNPPYFNIAEGRNITATSTCGENVPEPELYCKLVGANWFDYPSIPKPIHGQACDYCWSKDSKLSHSVEYASDGTEKWWQSPPLSRGLKYNEVNVTISLGQEFHVAYVYLKMANSPRPGIWVLERSTDYGKTYKPWQYFADTKEECSKRFGAETNRPILKDNSVICETKFSKLVPLEGGEIVVPLLNNRPNAENFSMSQVLQEWTRATNIRLRLLRPKTTLGDKFLPIKQDPTVTRRYFYSIKDINVGGRCVCNGHANTCDFVDPSEPQKLYCQCQHNTCGAQCEQCCPGFVQKKWKPATVNNPNECEECNCFGHSSECHYDEEVDKKRQSLDKYGQYSGGGYCDNCQHNTEGINCHLCKPKFYRPFNRPLNATNVCEPCNCDERFSTGHCFEGSGQCECKKQYLPPNCDACSYGYYSYPECRECDCFINGTYGQVCELRSGDCPCLPNYSGKFCRECAKDFYGYPDCKSCDCNPEGSSNPSCNVETGQCSCRNSYGGRQCDRCDVGYYNYPQCTFCNCDSTGTTEEVCDSKSGTCLCKPGFSGSRCDQCAPGYFGFPNCRPCECNSSGSRAISCNADGKCQCLPSFGGLKCDSCAPGYFGYPKCRQCRCDSSGSHGITCDDNGKCTCKENFDGEKCDKCKANFYNYPLCEKCDCHPAGVLATFAGCGSLPAGELCECKERVTGRKCDTCKDLFWNLRMWNPHGCEPCKCHIPGTVSGLELCNGLTGQCICKKNVRSQKCDECVDGTFAVSKGNLFGCEECSCNVGGAISSLCNKETGNCICRPRITGRKCDMPLRNHYFPTLYQHQFEMEDGFTSSSTPARFDYNETIFPGYSWRGYAVFSDIQREVILDIYIAKERLFRPVFRYINLESTSVRGALTLTPDFDDSTQNISVIFEPTKAPKKLLVVGKSGIIVPPFVLTPGRWRATLQVDNNLLVDYMVLLPQNYYEALILREPSPRPCSYLNQSSHVCSHYSYSELPATFASVRADTGRFKTGGDDQATKLYTDMEITRIGLREGQLAKMDQDQLELEVKLRLPQRGKYALIITYHTPEPLEDETSSMVMNVEVKHDEQTENGMVILTRCFYTFACRQVVKNADGAVMLFYFNQSDAEIMLSLADVMGSRKGAGIYTVTAIPQREWSIDYAVPEFVCLIKDNDCIDSKFAALPEATKFEFKTSLKKPGDSLDSKYYEVPGEDDSEPTLIYGAEGSSIDMEGSVPKPGLYNLVVHYQSKFPSFELEVTLGNQSGFLPVKYCPRKSGCRSVVQRKAGALNSTSFEISNDFSLTLKHPEGRIVGLDYILAVPSDFYSSEILGHQIHEESGHFIKECGQDAFYISDKSSAFCKETVFALTTEYNNGAQACKCNTEGSTSYECEPFGGQCACKPNIIGRTCNACKLGFYGFPNCRPCNCPSTATCEQKTGQCVCPPRVTGPKCDTCLQLTYGFHPILGCQECKCHPHGVLNNDLQCHSLTGECKCKQHIVGRTCDKCKQGYWSFPHCTLCDCYTSGTTDKICDPLNSKCFCKKNVQGESCDQCRPDSYYLEEQNPVGCTKCFCFGTSDRCRSSSLGVATIADMSNPEWAVVKLGFKDENVLETNMKDNVEVRFTQNQVRVRILDPSKADTSSTAYIEGIYLKAPRSYGGKRITSYGLNFTFVAHDVVEEQQILNHTASAVAPDVVIIGGNLTLIHESLDQPEQVTQPWKCSVVLNEKHFTKLNGGKVTREQMMVALVNVQALYVRGSYFEPASEIHVIDVNLETTTEEFRPGSRLALSVEQCSCPKNYRGTSCEECAPGYYRARAGPYLGYCIPCKCHGHADECDVETGKCLNCKHNTVGDHCEKCAPGYHGNGTYGTPMDCLICACPQPIESNNFADSCEIRETDRGQSVIKCQCKKGYYGATCDVCANGYYGRPNIIGDYCKPCNCSGNIDTSMDGSCDSETGLCMKCLHNTAGSACQYCSQNYYGDAVFRKDCKQCNCNVIGTARCDNYTGLCDCRPNVEGQQCDRCRPNHWNFNSRRGCEACNCGLASVNGSCNLETGQCFCREGATGMQCESCKVGYWNYNENGCQSCNCVDKYSEGTGCDPYTGQCRCLQGVIGGRCDSCPHRWVFIKKEGCFKCDSCVHFLLDDTDKLAELIDPAREELRDVSTSVFAYKKLSYVNKTLDDMRGKTGNLIQNPKAVDLSRIEKPLLEREEQVDKMKNSAESHLKTADKNSMIAFETREAIESNYTSLLTTVESVRRLVEEMKRLEAGFMHTEKVMDIESKIQMSEAIFSSINGTTFAEQQKMASEEQQFAEKALKSAEDFKAPAVTVAKNITNSTAALKKLEDIFGDLSKQITKALEIAIKAQNAHQKTSGNLKKEIEPRIVKLKELEQGARNTLTEALKLVENSKSYPTTVDLRMVDVGNYAERLKRSQENLKTRSDETRAKNADVLPLVIEAKQHADELKAKATQLDKDFENARKSSKTPIDAANAYKHIIESIESASVAAQNATIAAEDAKTLSEGVADSALANKTKSLSLRQQASQLESRTLSELNDPFEAASRQVNDTNQKLMANQKAYVVVRGALGDLANKKVNESGKNAKQIANEAYEKAAKPAKDIEVIEARILASLERAKLVPKEHDGVSEDIKQANVYASKVTEMVPQISRLSDSIPEKQNILQRSMDELSAKLKELKKNVSIARSLANRIKLNMHFKPDTQLQLRTPEDVEKVATFSKLSLVFNTTSLDGLLVYMGNPINRSATPDPASGGNDFLALEIRNGRLAYTMDLGSGPTTITSEKYVSSGDWHRAEIVRVGKVVTMTVTDERTQLPSTTQGVWTGASNVLDLDSERSKVYLGSIPPDVQVQDRIGATRFEGEMEEISLNDKPLGLWNFITARALNGTTKKSSLQPPPTDGATFNGESYVILLKKDRDFSERTFLNLRFKTFAEDGLIFLIGGKSSYLSLFLKEGKAHFVYKLGDEVVRISSSERYNDGVFHNVDASRKKGKAILSIDSVQIGEGSAQGPNTNLETSQFIYVGGYPNSHSYREVTNSDFQGCIQELQIGSQPEDLNQNHEALGIVSGCHDTLVREASFSNQTNSYLAMRFDGSLNEKAEISLKFKTTQPSGLLFAASSSDYSSYFLIYLKDGSIVVKTQPGSTIVTRQGLKYNDGEWHFVTAKKDQREIQLNVDDKQRNSAADNLNNLEIATDTVYFGGVPPDWQLSSTVGDLPNVQSFAVCIGDVIVNDEIQNFARSRKRSGVSLSRCVPRPIDVIMPPVSEPDMQTPESSQPPQVSSEPSEVLVQSPPTPTVTQAPRPDQCKLPLVPNADPDISLENGQRFGNSLHSRHEFEIPGSVTSSLLDQSSFGLDFKAEGSEGTLFYVTDSSNIDFVGLYMHEGKIYFSFNCGTGAALIVSDKVYNDSNWHTAVFSVRGRNGILRITSFDGSQNQTEQKFGHSMGDSNSLNLKSPVYVGGLSVDVAKVARNKLKGVIESFPGCIKKLHIQAEEYKFVAGSTGYDVQPCSDKVEYGTFFHGNGYAVLYDEFRIGSRFGFSMEIKPRNLTGVLMSVHGIKNKNDYLVVEMIEGDIIVTVDNGAGPFSTKYHPASKNFLCDGKWHTVEGFKETYMVTLSVDSLFSEPGWGVGGVSATDTDGPLYVGGVPEDREYLGLMTKTSFVGCIRSLEINSKPEKFSNARISGRVTLNSCSTL